MTPNPATQEPIGLLAGWGRFPVLFAEKAKTMGIPVVCMGFRGMADRDQLAPLVHRFHWTRLGSLNWMIRGMRNAGVRRWTMAGKVFKLNMYKPWKFLTLLPDLRLIRTWWFNKRRDNCDDTIILSLINEFARDGLTCTSALDLCPELLVQAGVLTKRKPTASEEQDIAFGWNLAKEMGRLDIGQSVMVSDRAVLAVEAIEGTDIAIQRAGDLCRRSGFTVVKVAKPQQDMRFDVPTIGTSTIETMKKAGARVLAIEANKTILLDAEKTIALANRHGITIKAI
ncbi:MAG: UDP-2,3-diacylglucosamine diphosphatase LpxI [Planctomycetes bacterium]|nr:UDP-2,3-diacylglucosamine diphosphatase LpxI [Planctomycetota bacterium]